MIRTLITLGIAILLNSCSFNMSDNKSGELVVAADTASIKYQCPMKCQGDTAYTTAGQCPVCGMDLVKIDDEQDK